MSSALPIVQRAPRSLKVHPLIRHLPQWSDQDPRMESLVEDIRSHGILEPLKITSDEKLADGRHRWRAAIAAGLELVPCVVVPDDDLAQVVLSLVIQRRHYTKGQRAYACYPLLVSAHEEITKDRERRLKAGGKASTAPRSIEGLASTIGVGVDLLRQAARLHEIFGENEELRDQFEAAILDDEKPIGLGAALAGIASHKATAGQERPEVRDADQLWFAGFKTFALRSVKIDAKNVKPFVRQLLADFPDADAIDHLRAVAVEIERESSLRLRSLGVK